MPTASLQEISNLDKFISYPHNVLLPLPDRCLLKESYFRWRLEVLSKRRHRKSNKNSSLINFQILPWKKLNNFNIECISVDLSYNISDCLYKNGWLNAETLMQQKCYFLIGMEYIRKFEVTSDHSASIMEWNSNCGHHLFWAYQYYGVLGVAIGGNKQYSMEIFNIDYKSFIGFCDDDISLKQVGNNSVDYLIAVDSISYLPEEIQCDMVIKDFIRISNHKIWIAGNSNQAAMTKVKWTECLNKVKDIDHIHYKIVDELYYDTYSIFIRKLRWEYDVHCCMEMGNNCDYCWKWQ